MTINQRVQKIIDELFSGNKRSFSAEIGVSPTVTENIVGKRKSNPSYEVTTKIIHSIENINIEWLLTGKGEMLKVNTPIEKGGTNINLVSEQQLCYGKTSSNNLKPFLDSIDINLGIPDSFNIGIKSEAYKNIMIPFIGDYDFSIRNYGNSMINLKAPQRSINDQDIVACKLWKNKSHILWGEVYALATVDGYIIKRLMPSESKDYVKCVSFNEDNGYSPFELSISEIFDWAIVVGVASIKAW